MGVRRLSFVNAGPTKYGIPTAGPLHRPSDPVVVLDFNQAYNPYCAYAASGKCSCPIPPTENRLPVAIRAGVRSDH
ncbi:DUF1684 domain-containing protein [Hymenobacter cellulosilyticus]|uniref:DUF1684 domain-containing protein n=1 Tax=Hymenobacter cellulosilyticus TaxID=2932248 RepID=A0A8T9QCT1_9BACT|nr:DUF1684 domain-containing protein [Hymenobacter cellulosilyticus]UOQ73640.1 DUF1684 domain-containing protein [Hymenobacter cellulosilyticus]